MDRQLNIATAPHRTTRTWTNTTTTWETLKQRLANHQRTQETTHAFHQATKKQQAAIKDTAGGYLGGHLKGGRRRKDTVENRSLVCIDLDHPAENWQDALDMLLPNFECVIYSTHSHTPHEPRLRLVYPLTRNIAPSEYESVAQAITADVPEDWLDPSTFQAERFMYWPSCPKDAEPVYLVHNEGAGWCNPDTLTTQQPPLTATDTGAQVPAVKTPSPLVEAFNQAYTIPQAIATFLPDTYQPSDDPHRYTYTQGTSDKGLVIHPDGKASSFHGTDPVGESVNAFDLVRIHLFDGPTVTHGWDASCQRMSQLIMDDPRCRAFLPQEVLAHVAPQRRSTAAEDFATTTDPATTPTTPATATKTTTTTSSSGSSGGTRTITYTAKGKPTNTIENICALIQNANPPINLYYNTLTHLKEIQTTWTIDTRPYTDVDESKLTAWLEKTHELYSPTKLQRAVDILAYENTYSPVTQWLENLPPWDGTPRAATLLIDYLGAPDTPYTREATMKALRAIIHRAYTPGTKFDNVLTIVGPQGCGKSTLLKKIGSDWYNDSLTLNDMKDKTGAEKIQGTVVCEIGELAGMRKADNDIVKGFITRTEDKYRPAYGHNTEIHPRTCVFFGTTNNIEGFLRDTTGNRRFWPIVVTGNSTHKPWDLTEDTREQIFAELMADYAWNDDPAELILTHEAATLANQAQRDAIEYDERSAIVREYLDTDIPTDMEKQPIERRQNWYRNDTWHNLHKEQHYAADVVQRTVVSRMEIWCECFGGDPAKLDARNRADIAKIMVQMEGWEPHPQDRVRRGVGYGVQRGVYIRTSSLQPKSNYSDKPNS